MGELQIHTQEPIITTANSPKPKCDTESHNTNEPLQVVEPADLFALLHLNCGAGNYSARHPPCANPMKRRSPSSSSSDGERSAKKLLCEQEDLTLHGFSAISLPLAIAGGKVFRRCVSDLGKPPADLPENSAGGSPSVTPVKGSGLPPLPPSLKRSVSDLSGSPGKALTRCLNSEETTPDSMRLRRMKDRMREMKQWWDEVMKDEDEALEECAIAVDDKILTQDELGGDSEEAVSVEWVDKCLSLTFRCPCGKGYEVLLSASNCYYKLV